MHHIWQHMVLKGSQIGWIELCLIPVWAAFISWLTIWLAMKMIFRPRRAIIFLGLEIQGLIHKHRQDLATFIAQTIEQHLISQADVLAIINRPTTQNVIQKAIEKKVEEFLEHKLKKIHPMIGMVLGGSVRQKLQKILSDEIRHVIPQLADQMMTKLKNEVDFQAIVVEKINQLDFDQFEVMIHDIAARELRMIKLFFTLLGFVLGLMQVAILLF